MQFLSDNAKGRHALYICIKKGVWCLRKGMLLEDNFQKNSSYLVIQLVIHRLTSLSSEADGDTFHKFL